MVEKHSFEYHDTGDGVVVNNISHNSEVPLIL